MRIHYEFYPPESLRAHEQGNCSVSLFLDALGIIRAAQLVESTGYPRLDAACLISVQGQRMLPATLNGNPISTWVTVPITWKTAGTPPAAAPVEASVPVVKEDFELPVGPNYYPADARARNEAGVCAVWVSVSAEGHVTQSKVLKSTGSESLDKACTDALWPAPFTPAKKDGADVRAGALLTLFWTL